MLTQQERPGDLDIVKRLVVVAAFFRRSAAHREAAGRQIDKRHAGPVVRDDRKRRVDFLAGADVEPAEASVGRDVVHAIAVAERVLLAHFPRDRNARAAVELERRGDDRAHRRLLDLQLGLDDAAGGRVDPEPAVRHQIACPFAAHHCRRCHLLVFNDRDARLGAPVVLAEREAESTLIAPLQHAERQHRIAEGAAHVAEVVARAFLTDSLCLRHRVGRCVHEELREARLAIAHSDAVDCDHVAKRHQRRGFKRLDQQEVRSEITVPRPQHLRRRRQRRPAAPADDRREARKQHRRLLDIDFLGHDVFELVDEGLQIPSRAVEHDVERRAGGCLGGRRHSDRGAEGQERVRET